jgi:hypothetical protein
MPPFLVDLGYHILIKLDKPKLENGNYFNSFTFDKYLLKKM